jgi:hypothetical protein
VKRAEEGNDDLVNHPLQKNKAPILIALISPSPPERVANPSVRVFLRPGYWRRLGGLPMDPVAESTRDIKQRLGLSHQLVRMTGEAE